VIGVDIVDILNTSICCGESNDDQDESAECYDCIILNTDDIDELNNILEVSDVCLDSFSGLSSHIIKRATLLFSSQQFLTASTNCLIKRPRIILLSKLLSWGGKKYKVPIGSSISEFNARNPYLTEEALYKVENRFQTVAALTKLDMCIVGIGLIYGAQGFDFAPLCK
jgi:hypothetical protein